VNCKGEREQIIDEPTTGLKQSGPCMPSFIYRFWWSDGNGHYTPYCTVTPNKLHCKIPFFFHLLKPYIQEEIKRKATMDFSLISSHQDRRQRGIISTCQPPPYSEKYPMVLNGSILSAKSKEHKRPWSRIK
jgi:hypothetical protein